MAHMYLEKILNKALAEVVPTREEILYLLKLTNPIQRGMVAAAARKLREHYFGNKVFLYGFVYFSTYCRNDCTFCFYRKSNHTCRRYRKTTSEIVEIACALAETGVHLIDLTMGEDPEYLSCNDEGYDKLIKIVEEVKRNTGLPLMISPGVVPKDVLRNLKKAGANWYACYQETHNKKLYEKLRLDQSYDKRWDSKVFARSIGLVIEEGLLVGVGDSMEDIADSLFEMESLGAEQIRTMSFVPQLGTPLYKKELTNDLLELNIISVMRLMFPNRLIPASMDVEGISGLKERLEAGANVVTSLIPAQSGLAGVSQSSLDITEGNRTVNGILPTLKACGLIPATQGEYKDWVAEMQAKAGEMQVEEERMCGLL